MSEAYIEVIKWFSGTKLRTQFSFHVVDGNGEIIASGEGYTRKADAIRGAKNLVETIAYLRRHGYEVVDAT